MKNIYKTKYKGFTLLEILLVIAAIGILAAIVLVAINPNRQLAQARNAQRRSDVNAISSAVYQKIIDDAASNVTTMNTTLVDATVYALGTGATAVCGPSGTTLVVTGTTAALDLTSQLVSNYVSSVPFDPSGGSAVCTGYTITQAATDGRITVTAPRAELSATISVTR
jgi:type IV pilus assembly protein PilA